MFDVSRYVGIPYADRGRTARGADCWGLVRLVYREQFGIELPSLDGRYASPTDSAGIAGAASDIMRCDWTLIELPEPGDVALMTIAGRPFHVAIVIPGNKFLHNPSAPQGAVIESLSDPRWRRRVEGFYRHAGRN